MTDLTLDPNTFSAVYQLETTDPVLAGPGGISNRQAQELGNRTAFIKRLIDEELFKRISGAHSQNLNTLVARGVFDIKYSATMTNDPTYTPLAGTGAAREEGGFLLIVAGDGTDLSQTVIAKMAAGGSVLITQNRVYRRTSADGGSSWSAWTAYFQPEGFVVDKTGLTYTGSPTHTFDCLLSKDSTFYFQNTTAAIWTLALSNFVAGATVTLDVDANSESGQQITFPANSKFDINDSDWNSGTLKYTNTVAVAKLYFVGRKTNAGDIIWTVHKS